MSEVLSKATKELFHAINKKDPNKIIRAIEDGANVEAIENEYTALSRACYAENLESVIILVRNKALINKKDNKGNMPIIYAARYGKANIVSFLIENGADIEMRNDNGYTTLMTAKLENSLGVIAVIEEHLKRKETPVETTEKWVRNNNSGISFIGIYPSQEQKITQTFNFVTRQQITTVKDIVNKRTSSPLITSFNDLDKKVIEKVLEEFKSQGGKTDKDFIISGDNHINKPKPSIRSIS